MRPDLLWASRAWLPGALEGAQPPGTARTMVSATAGSANHGTAAGWHDHVLLRIGADGCWSAIEPGVHQPPEGAEVLAGPLLPGLVDAHSHAFQRAFAGLAERLEPADADGGANAGADDDVAAVVAAGANGSAAASDDFWSWRDRMYRVARRVTPVQLQAIATQLYIELLAGGYTQVCEFHYLRGAPDGTPYADPVAMARALADAAGVAGIGLTVLPVLYERAGFELASLSASQRRFACDAQQVWSDHRALVADGRPLLRSGIAIHSLRAADMASIHTLRRLADQFDGPIHIHVSEQTAEVDDCLRATGQRPIEHLAHVGVLDARWQLVHATHATPAEIDAVAGSGAGVVLCPSTEANLGDGLADLPRWLAAGVPLAVGSDSNVTRCWTEELRWLEYGQRLQRRQRNVAASTLHSWARHASSGERLWSAAVAASGPAAGFARWGLQVGSRADALVVDPAAGALLGVPPGQTLDALVFSSPGPGFRDVLVAGAWAIRSHRHAASAPAADAFRSAMDELWARG